MAAIKVKAKDLASSAKAGMEKAKATAAEKVEKATTTEPAKKQEAERRKKERKQAAESGKRHEVTQHGVERRVTHVAGRRRRIRPGRLPPSPPGLAYSLGDLYGLTEATFADPSASGYTEHAAATGWARSRHAFPTPHCALTATAMRSGIASTRRSVAPCSLP